jgi:hypothetical protein
MYLNAEQIARLNQAVQNTFEQTSIAWQAIPHWDTGDPGQVRVRVDYSYEDAAAIDGLAAPLGGKSVALRAESVRFAVTVAQATAPTPDALLDAVIARTVKLAAQVDNKVIGELASNELPSNKAQIATTAKIEDLLNTLIDARAKLENAGYRAPSCLLTDTAGLKSLNQIEDGLPQIQSLLDAANINSLYRVDNWGDQGTTNDQGKADDQGKAGDADKAGDAGKAGDADKGRLLLLGRRQRIAHGGAAAASPGEEPADLAVSVAPSLEIVGETNQGNIELAVRIRFAPRVTDKHGIIGVTIS